MAVLGCADVRTYNGKPLSPGTISNRCTGHYVIKLVCRAVKARREDDVDFSSPQYLTNSIAQELYKVLAQFKNKLPDYWYMTLSNFLDECKAKGVRQVPTTEYVRKQVVEAKRNPSDAEARVDGFIVERQLQARVTAKSPAAVPERDHATIPSNLQHAPTAAPESSTPVHPPNPTASSPESSAKDPNPQPSVSVPATHPKGPIPEPTPDGKSAASESVQRGAETASVKQQIAVSHQPSSTPADHTAQNDLQLAALRTQIKQFEAENLKERQELQAELENYKRVTRCWESEREQFKQQQAERQVQYERQQAELQAKYEQQQAELQALRTKLEQSQKELESTKRTASEAAGDQHDDRCEAPAEKRRRVLREFCELSVSNVDELFDVSAAYQRVVSRKFPLSQVFTCMGARSADCLVEWNLVTPQQCRNMEVLSGNPSRVSFEFTSFSRTRMAEACDRIQGGHES